ncbi:hypothetical protein NCD_03830 [Burkholderia pseudomallei]
MPSRSLVSWAPAIVYSAKPDTTIASASDRPVIAASKPMRMGSVTDSTPMTCIDQMPTPIATALPASHAWRSRPCASSAIRPDRSSAV